MGSVSMVVMMSFEFERSDDTMYFVLMGVKITSIISKFCEPEQNLKIWACDSHQDVAP